MWQVCDGRTEIMVKVAELINEHMDVDFVDINVGVVHNDGLTAYNYQS